MKLRSLSLAIIGLAAITAITACGGTASVNPECTPSAVVSFNAYWQSQVSDASLANVQTVIAAGIAATAAREKLCKGTPAD